MFSSAPVEIPLQIARRLILSTDFRESVLSFFREVSPVVNEGDGKYILSLNCFRLCAPVRNVQVVMNPDVKNLISESFISVSRELVQDVRKSGALLTIVDNVLVGVPSSYVRGSTEEEEQRSASLAIVRGDSSQSNVPESTSSLPMESSSSLGGDAVRVEYDSLHTDDPSYHAILSRVAAHRRLWGPGPTYPLGAALPTILAPLVARCGCDERTKRRIIMVGCMTRSRLQTDLLG